MDCPFPLGDWCPVDNLLTISRLREVMDGHIRQNYSFEAGGCTVCWEVSMEGFDNATFPMTKTVRMSRR